MTMFISPLISISCIVYENLDLEVKKLNVTISKETKLKYTVDEFIKQDYKKLISFSNIDYSKYEVSIFGIKKLSDTSINLFIELKSKKTNKTVIRKIEIKGFKTNSSLNDKEQFDGLEPDKGLEKLPYPISENELKANHATPITVNHVADGDTFYDTKGNKYRFNGVDTPESFKKDPETGNFIPTTGMQKEYATYASKFTEYYSLNGLLPTYSQYKLRPTQIYAVPQKTKNGKSNISDHYGRIVAIIYYRDEFGRYHCLNEKLVLEGKARKNYISLSKSSKYYTENKEYFYLLEAAQQKAKKLKKGIWSPLADYNKIFP